jgi:hypothetical protein
MLNWSLAGHWLVTGWSLNWSLAGHWLVTKLVTGWSLAGHWLVTSMWCAYVRLYSGDIEEVCLYESQRAIDSYQMFRWEYGSPVTSAVTPTEPNSMSPTVSADTGATTDADTAAREVTADS